MLIDDTDPEKYFLREHRILMTAIVRESFKDAKYRGKSRKMRHIKQDALVWFFDEAPIWDEYIFSYKNICSLCDIRMVHIKKILFKECKENRIWFRQNPPNDIRGSQVEAPFIKTLFNGMKQERIGV
jgi:hypothetical protein